MANVRVNGSQEVHRGVIVNDDVDGVDVDIVVNFNPTANIVGNENTLKGGNSNSVSESESTSKATAEGGGEFSPGPDTPPGQGNGKSDGALVKVVKKVLPGKKTPKDAKEKKPKD